MAETSRQKVEGGQNTGLNVLSDSSLQSLYKRANNKPKKTKDDWRSIFALIILSGHFLLIGGIVFIWALGRDVDSVIKILSAVGSLLGSPLGFVIGYYYKDRGK